MDVYVDFCGPYTESEGYRCVCTCTCKLLRVPILEMCRSLNLTRGDAMQAVLSCMLKALAIPAIWRHDLGPEFTNALFEEVSILLGIQEMLSARRRRCHQAMRMRSASLPLPWPPAGWNKPGAWVSRQRSGDTLPQWGARRGKGSYFAPPKIPPRSSSLSGLLQARAKGDRRWTGEGATATPAVPRLSRGSLITSVLSGHPWRSQRSACPRRAAGVEAALALLREEGLDIELESSQASSWTSTAVVRSSGGEAFFLKASQRPAKAAFAGEAEGLRRLQAAAGDALKIPTVRTYADDGQGGSFMILEHLPPAPLDMERLGFGIASLHMAPPEADGRFGFPEHRLNGRLRA
eukprot:s392_g22.t1